MEGLADEVTAVFELPSVENLSEAQAGILAQRIVARCTFSQLVEVLHVTLFAMREHVQGGVKDALDGHADLTAALQRYQDVNDALRAAMVMFSIREIGRS